MSKCLISLPVKVLIKHCYYCWSFAVSLAWMNDTIVESNQSRQHLSFIPEKYYPETTSQPPIIHICMTETLPYLNCRFFLIDKWKKEKLFIYITWDAFLPNVIFISLIHTFSQLYMKILKELAIQFLLFQKISC